MTRGTIIRVAAPLLALLGFTCAAERVAWGSTARKRRMPTEAKQSPCNASEHRSVGELGVAPGAQQGAFPWSPWPPDPSRSGPSLVITGGYRAQRGPALVTGSNSG